MNRKIIFSMLFLALSVSAFAQMRVFPDGRIGFGRYLENNRGIFINEAPNLVNPMPFSIVRNGADEIFLSRHVGLSEPTNGIQLSRDGRRVKVGDLAMFWGTGSHQTSVFSVGAPWLSHGIQVYKWEPMNTDGVRVMFYPFYGGVRPFVALNNNQVIFYVNEFGDVFSRGNGTTSDLSQKENIEPIENALK